MSIKITINIDDEEIISHTVGKEVSSSYRIAGGDGETSDVDYGAECEDGLGLLEDDEDEDDDEEFDGNSKLLPSFPSIGKTVKEAEENAVAFAQQVYNSIPINHKPGQAFKNQFVKSFLETSYRARSMAKEVLGIGERKPVTG